MRAVLILLAAAGALLSACGDEHDPDVGKVTLTVRARNTCPRLTSWMAAPLQTSVGGAIDVSAGASDPDPGDHLRYLWTASAGSFARPDAASTRYSCGAAGLQTITVQVSDDASCADAHLMAVRCK